MGMGTGIAPDRCRAEDGDRHPNVPTPGHRERRTANGRGMVLDTNPKPEVRAGPAVRKPPLPSLCGSPALLANPTGVRCPLLRSSPHPDRYYNQGCPSWKWFYPYHYSPFPSDLSACIDPANRYIMEVGVPFLPFEQLMGSLPPPPWLCTTTTAPY